MYLCYMFANIVINLHCPRAYEPPLCQIELQQLHFLSLVTLSVACFMSVHLTLSVTWSISMPLVHCSVALPLISPLLSAAFFVSLRRVLRCSPPSAVLLFAACRYPPSPLVVILRRLLCHTPSCSSDIPHTYAIKFWVKNLTLTTIIQYLFYIRSSKENWPNVKKYQWKTIEDLKRTYCNFFTNDLSSSSSSVSDFASHSWPPTISATWRRRWRKHLPHFKSERRTFELAIWPISQKISLLC